jgi:hypothetical protein
LAIRLFLDATADTAAHAEEDDGKEAQSDSSTKHEVVWPWDALEYFLEGICMEKKGKILRV